MFNDKNHNNIHDSIEEILKTNTKTSVLVCYNSKPGQDEISDLTNQGIELSYVCKYIDVIITKEISRVEIEKITGLPGVDFIEPVPEVKPLMDISTRAVKARESEEYSPNTAWELGYTGKGITIAILDTGVDDGHPDLEGKFVAGADFAGATGRITTKNGRYNPDDDTGHGTAIAGIAMSAGGVDGTYKGIAPDARLVDVRVTLGRGGDLVASLEWCIDNRNTDWNNNGLDEYDGIDVVSVSVGGDENSDGSDRVSQLVNQVVDAGIVVVTAIGNSGPNNQGIGNVAAADKVITVGNLNDQNTVARSDDAIESTSTRGPRSDDGDSDPYDELKPDVVAPGMNIITPDFSIVGQSGNGYDMYSGSSMSCPHVSGICALMLEAKPELNPLEIRQILQETAEAIGEPSVPELSDKYNYASGYGSVDAYTAIKEARTFEPSNHRPVIKSVTASPKYVEPNGQATITTVASDEDGDNLNYNYTATGGEISGSGDKVTWTAPDETGSYDIRVVVDDGILTSEPEIITVVVETDPTNHPPVINDIKVDPTVVEPGGSSTIIVTASDPDDDELEFIYSASGGGIIGTGSKVVWSAPMTNGKYTISISVTDGELDSELEKVVITVEGEVENKPPEIDSITATPQSVASGESVKLYVKAIDPERGKLQYSYKVTDGKISGTGANVTWLAPIAPGGQIIEVTVTDELGLTDSDDIFIDVYQKNYPPEILSMRVNPNNPKSDGKTEIFITVKVDDENGLSDITKVTIDLSTIFGDDDQKMYDDGKSGDVTRNDGIYSYSYLIPKSVSGGVKVLKVRIQDRFGEMVTSQVGINVTEVSDESDDGLFGGYFNMPGFEGEILLLAVIFIISIFLIKRSNIRYKY
jgi:serine protease AprX